MSDKLKKCFSCNTYTLKKECSQCNEKTRTVENKYSSQDKYFNHRMKEYEKRIREKIKNR